MKYFVITLTLLAAEPGALLWAQANVSADDARSTAPAATPAPTKIGLVNIGVLLRDQDKVKAFKVVLDLKVKPFDDKAKVLEKYIESWHTALKDPSIVMTPDQRKEGHRVIKECLRQIEDLEKEYHDGIGTELGTEMIALNMEVKHAIKVYAEAHGYHLILAYGEPEVPLPLLKETQRRMTAIDAGQISFVPLTGPSNVDITRGVLDLLNTSYRAGAGKMAR